MIATTNRDDWLSSPYDYPDESNIIGECEICGHVIYKGEPHYRLDDVLICDELKCLHEYVDRCGLYEG